MVVDEAHARTARRVVAQGEPVTTRRVGGLDVAYPGGAARAAAVVLDAASLAVVAEATVHVEDPAPYVPGYLYRRELPAMLAALAEPRIRDLAPEVPWLVDGHGLLHPSRSGLACHVGVAAGVQTVGVGKSPLVDLGPVPPLEPGGAHPLGDGTALLGFALRSTARSRNPIYVSPGHRIGPREALALVLPLCRYRVPEPVRRADQLAGAKGAR